MAREGRRLKGDGKWRREKRGGGYRPMCRGRGGFHYGLRVAAEQSCNTIDV
jgi:hypothetical protein